ncbi:MAG: hypothetical protein QOF61_1242, partial [Acidobacteriota bacterium]|jgi:hypothetical protein|nr:hypothetical protein [Acidobacteriota bacterium]
MRTLRRFSTATLSLALCASFSPALVSRHALAATDDPATAAQQQFGALERGYRTGYSDGYQSGYSDSVNNRARDFRGKEDYQRADRVYVPAYGSLEDYRDGYQQGFESGYATGFDRQGFDSTVPTTLRRRGASAPSDNTARDASGRPIIRRDDSSNRRDNDNNNNPPVDNPTPAGAFDVPANTVMRVELLSNLSTDVSQRGDRFEARVVEPAQFANAVVTGRVTSVRRPGKVRGSGELQLNFQQIRLTDGRTAGFSAQVTEIVNTRTDSDTGEVDPEGGVHGRNTNKDDITKVGAATGIGAIIGAIAGGGKGAAIGAVIGAGVGTGGVMTARGRDIRLQRGQQLVIRTSADTRIQ